MEALHLILPLGIATNIGAHVHRAHWAASLHTHQAGPKHVNFWHPVRHGGHSTHVQAIREVIHNLVAGPPWLVPAETLHQPKRVRLADVGPLIVHEPAHTRGAIPHLHALRSDRAVRHAVLATNLPALNFPCATRGSRSVHTQSQQPSRSCRHQQEKNLHFSQACSLSDGLLQAADLLPQLLGLDFHPHRGTAALGGADLTGRRAARPLPSNKRS
mmetsp:Transcript_28979/g.63795  ORF Transcript_28979/g.63795 Transcript_28979/m.63795 type:complete len:215 (-) Transcript_28979:3-647(-)